MNTPSTAYLSQLHREHGTFRCLLGVLETQVQALGEGQPDYWLMQDVLDYLENYPRYGHDLLEAGVLQALAVHAPESSAVLGDMPSFHQSIQDREQCLGHYLAAIQVGELVPLEHIKAAAQNYIDGYKHYMSIEEQLAFPLAAEVMNRADWLRIDEAIAASNGARHNDAMQRRFGGFGARIAQQVGCSTYGGDRSARSGPSGNR